MKKIYQKFTGLFFLLIGLSFFSPLPAKPPLHFQFNFKKPQLVLVSVQDLQNKITRGIIARVQRVIDGDTIVLQGGQRVRLIGIDTPEKKEPLCKEATKYVKKMILHKDVILQFDRTKKDRYGRLLANIFVDQPSSGVAKNMIFLNGQLILQGLASVYPYSPNLRFWKVLTRMQKSARNLHRGLWGLAKRSHDPYYVGSKYRFHRSTCRNARRIKRHRRIFKNMDKALDLGLSPARCCKP